MTGPHPWWIRTHIPAPKNTPSVVCCEREAIEPETPDGVSHDDGCPSVARELRDLSHDLPPAPLGPWLGTS